MRNLRRGLIGLGAAAALVVAFAGGAFVDQTFPEYVPNLTLGGGGHAQLDRASTDQALRVIEANYYTSNINYDTLSNGSIKGMVAALNDPYSQYLSPSEYRGQQDQYAGRHNGMIGIAVAFTNGYPVVASVLPASPALKAGLESDDVITAVDGHDTHNLPQDQVTALIRGASGTQVTLRVSRPDGDRDVTVTRSNFRSPTVQSTRLGGILYLRIYQFGDSTQQEFDSQLAAGLPGAKGVVLDLRDNGGGFVSAATAVISRFVASGEAVEQRGRDGAVEKTNVDGNHPAAGLPVVVLVNGGTASASEIVSGSLQAHHRARLVGVKTFGKGSVQVDFQLNNGGDLHLTIAHWYLPDGRSIDKQGLAPDVGTAMPSTARMFDVVEPSRGHATDAQLNEALSLLGAG